MQTQMSTSSPVLIPSLVSDDTRRTSGAACRAASRHVDDLKVEDIKKIEDVKNK